MSIKEDIEECVIYIFKYDSLFEWFINQNVVPFGLEDYSDLYSDFLNEVIYLYKRDKKDTFFFNGNKLLISNCDEIISIDNFKISVNKLNSLIRNMKLEEILNS